MRKTRRYKWLVTLWGGIMNLVKQHESTVTATSRGNAYRKAFRQWIKNPQNPSGLKRQPDTDCDGGFVNVTADVLA